MNDEQVFAKTSAGEEAIRERTRLVQRNLRMVLILVDGEANVAALKHEIGDAEMVDAALADLDRLGLIARVDSGDEGVLSADTVTADESTPLAEPAVSPAGDATEQIPVLNEVATDSEPVVAVPSEAPAIFGADQQQPATAGDDIRVNDDDRSEVRSDKPSMWVSLASWWQSRRRQQAEADEEAQFEKAYVETSTEDVTAIVRPSVQTAKRKLKWGPLLAMALLVAVVLGVSRLVFYPYDEHRAEFEQRLSAMLDDTVKIGNLRVSFVPLPVLALEQVTVGAPAYAKIEAIRLLPEPWTLIGEHQRYRQVVVEGMRVEDVAAAKIGRWFPSASMDGVDIGQIDLNNLTVGLGQGEISGLVGHLVLVERQGVAKLTLRAKEGTLEAELSPVPGGLSVSAKAAEWKTPFRIPLVLSALDVAGTFSPGRLVIDKFDALAYDGQINSKGSISWDREAKMWLTVNLDHLAAGKLLPVLGAPALLDGEISGRFVLAAIAPTVSRLEEGLAVEDGRFSVARGSLKRFDLAEALREGGQTDNVVRGGSTAFEELSGGLSMNSPSLRLVGLHLASGLLQASGQATVFRKNGSISGGATVELRGSSGVIRAPVSISGSIADPELRAAR